MLLPCSLLPPMKVRSPNVISTPPPLTPPCGAESTMADQSTRPELRTAKRTLLPDKAPQM